MNDLINDLINKYVPADLRDMELSVQYGGRTNFIDTFRASAPCQRNNKADRTKVHIEAIKGSSQGWSAFANVYQVILPNDDRLLVTWSSSKLRDAARAHMSARTGIVTMLQDTFSNHSGCNRTFTEIFGAPVRRNATSFPLLPNRIGDYGCFPGFQFKAGASSISGIEAINPQDDYRFSTNRKVSIPVYREIRKAADIVEGKADLLRNILGGSRRELNRWELARKVTEYIKNSSLGIDDSLSNTISNIDLVTRHIANVKYNSAIEMPYKSLVDGGSLKILKGSIPHQLLKLVKGDMTHEVLALMLVGSVHGWSKPKLIDLAPMFIMERGGYKLRKLER